jgi:rhamnose transport system ATP-binding protein
VILRDLSIASRHIVAMARALVGDSPIMIMDEPTAAMSHREIEEFYAIVERLREEGRAILFISHKFDEIFRIADDYVVLRDGELVGTGQIAETSRNALVTMMVGREISQIFPKEVAEIGEVVLTAQHLSHPTEFTDISFEVRRGEILGVYGLVGAGRTEVMQAIAGVGQTYDGDVYLHGQKLAKGRADRAVAQGVAYVPEERGLHGAVLGLPIYQNMTLPNLAAYTRRGFLDLARECEDSRRFAQLLDLRAANLSQQVGTLSGGNQQKIVIGKWMMTSPKVLILDEPTKGIDIGSKAQVHKLASRMAAEGLAVILVSSEIPEILGMSDRILVMRAGRIVAEISREDASAETLVRHAIGMNI